MHQLALANIVAYLRKKYPVGCRVMLDKMEDVQAPPIGTLGTVRGVDDAGSIAVAWDNGSSLYVLLDVDACHCVDIVPEEHRDSNAENFNRFSNQQDKPLK